MLKARSFISTFDQSMTLSPQPEGLFSAAAPDENTIVIDPTVRHQPFFGNGGNWTDTDIYNLLRMSPAQQDAVLEALFSREKGIGWNFMRVAFGSTDWERSADYYTYDDMPEGEKDWDLAHFSIQREVDRGLFDLLRRVQAAYPEIKLTAAVWGLPAWMKENDSIMYGRFDPACTSVYARYLRRAVQAWQQQGIELYSVSPQNESRTADDRATPATRFTWRMQRDLLKEMRREFDAHGLKTQIWCYDHNFDMADIFVAPLLADDSARSAIDAVAFHHYGGSPGVMGALQAQYPDMPFYMTERTLHGPADMGALVEMLHNGARSYIFWDFLADEYGGPHQFQGRPFLYRQPLPATRRPMIYNLLRDADRWEKGPIYGPFGQFSKFVRRGMVRIDSTYGDAHWVRAVAFSADDGQTMVLVVNQTDSAQRFTLRLGEYALAGELPAEAVGTWLFTLDADTQYGSLKVADAPSKHVELPPTWDVALSELWFDQEAVQGNEIRFKARVCNVGDAPTPAMATIFVEFSLDGDQQIGRAYGNCPVLMPGESAEVVANVPFGNKKTWTAEAGWHEIMALATVGNTFPERNPDNNRLNREFFFRGRA